MYSIFGIPFNAIKKFLYYIRNLIFKLNDIKSHYPKAEKFATNPVLGMIEYEKSI